MALRASSGSFEQWQVSTGGGSQVGWRGDGRELYYVDDNRRLMAVPALSAAPPRLGAPAALFASRLEEATDRQYDVFPDGRRFLLNRSLAEAREPISIVLGWTARLEKGGRQ